MASSEAELQFLRQQIQSQKDQINMQQDHVKMLHEQMKLMQEHNKDLQQQNKDLQQQTKDLQQQLQQQQQSMGARPPLPPPELPPPDQSVPITGEQSPNSSTQPPSNPPTSRVRMRSDNTRGMDGGAAAQPSQPPPWSSVPSPHQPPLTSQREAPPAQQQQQQAQQQQQQQQQQTEQEQEKERELRQQQQQQQQQQQEQLRLQREERWRQQQQQQQPQQQQQLQPHHHHHQQHNAAAFGGIGGAGGMGQMGGLPGLAGLLGGQGGQGGGLQGHGGLVDQMMRDEGFQAFLRQMQGGSGGPGGFEGLQALSPTGGAGSPGGFGGLDQQNLMQRYGGMEFMQLGSRDYMPSQGFAFEVFRNQPVSCSEDCRLVECLKPQPCTVVTRDVCKCEAEPAVFLVEVLNAGGGDGKSFGFGVVPGTPLGFHNLMIGDQGFPGTIGVVADEHGGWVKKNGEIIESTSGIRNGDIIGIRFGHNTTEFRINGKSLFMCGSHGGDRRLGISFQTKGQKCRLLAPDAALWEVAPEYSVNEGFHWDTSSSAAFFEEGVYVASATTTPTTIVTKETIDVNEQGKFLVEVQNAAGDTNESFTFGIMGAADAAAAHNLLGDLNFSGSVGLRAFQDCDYGALYKDGNPWVSTTAKIQDGVVVGVMFDNGRVSFLVDGAIVHEMGIEGGRRRFGVSFQCPGQACRLLSAAECRDYKVRSQWSADTGFHFAPRPSSATIEEDVAAFSITTTPATVITEEAIDISDTGLLLLEVLNAGGEAGRQFTFGIMGSADGPAADSLLGSSGFEGSVGLRASDDQGVLMTRGESFVRTACGIKDGDIVGVKFANGHVTFLINGRGVGAIGIEGGRRRFGVSFQCPGQACRILSVEESRHYQVLEPSPYIPSEGFHFDDSRFDDSAAVGVAIEDGRYAYSNTNTPMTIFTKQMVHAESDSARFFVQVLNAGGELKRDFTFGITGPPVAGAEKYLLGHANFHGTMGVQAGTTMGRVMHKGSMKCNTIGIEDNAIVGCIFEKGNVAFFIAGEVVYQVGISYACRFAISLQSPGQECILLDPTAANEQQVDIFNVTPYVPDIGFTFHSNDLVDLGADGRSFVSKSSARTTVFTRQSVNTKTGVGQIWFQVQEVGSDSAIFAFGIVPATPYGYTKHMIGDTGFSATQGVQADRTCGKVLHQGEFIFPTPGIKKGDVAGIIFSKGVVHFLLNGNIVYTFGAESDFCFGVSLNEPGQSCRMLTDATAAKEMEELPAPAVPAPLPSASAPAATPAPRRMACSAPRKAESVQRWGEEEPTMGLVEAVACTGLVHARRAAEQALGIVDARGVAQLTRDEAASVYLYTMEEEYTENSFYRHLNKALRDYPDVSPAEQESTRRKFGPFKRLIRSGVKKLRPFEGLVTRGIPEILPAKTGDPLHWGAFTSTTSDMDTLNASPFIGQKTTIFEITAKKAYALDPRLCENPAEDEILLLPDTMFQVDNVLNLRHVRIVRMTERS